MTSRLEILKDRSHLLQSLRAFFYRRNILEVDCPLLSQAASVDAHIDLIETEDRYLFSSPEYGMKRLLAEGFPDCYQMGHVFRKGELGRQHQPEFYMIEWYRLGFSLKQMMEETLDLIELTLGKQPRHFLSYEEAFQEYLEINPFEASDEKLLELLGEDYAEESRDELLNYLLALKIESHLGEGEYTVLYDFPASQAALAKVKNGRARRFEVYFRGQELANGYDELACGAELRERFHAANAKRLELGKEPLPLDQAFLHAVNHLSECCGVAVGFDRLMMLRHETKELAEVLTIPWERA